LVPIIAVTAFATGKVKNRCLEAGMNEVLIKPVPEKDLLRILYKYIGEKAVPEKQAARYQLKKGSNTAHQNKLNTLLKVFHDDDALLSKMTGIYSDNLDELISVLSKNKSDQDLGLIRNAAHKIMPSTRIMEFDKMATKLIQLENRIDKQCNFKDVEKLIKEILLESREVKTFIDDLLSAKLIEKG
jgi:CheY-like chemotaxis protein